MSDIIVRRTAMLWALGHFAPLVVLCATITFGFAATPAGLAISTEIAPPGGWAQIKIYAAKPMAIASGHLVLTLDATAFGTGAMVGLLGANGDATGIATTLAPTAAGQQIDVQFSSPTGGIGQLAGLPVMVISVPVLKSASGTVVVSATSPDSSVTVTSGSMTVGGTISVQKIYAGMGVVPAGTVVQVYGTGFTSSTAMTMDGVEIASTKFISAVEVDVTLGGAAELVGKRARVTDSGVEFDYFCFQPNDPVNFPSTTYFGTAVANVQPLFPLSAANGFTGFGGGVGGVVEVENPNSTAASVSFTNLNQYGSGAAQMPLSIPAGSWGIFSGADDSSFIAISDVPIRLVSMVFCGPGVALPVCLAPVAPYDNATEDPAPVAVPSTLAFAWQIGSSILPAPRWVGVIASESGVSRFTVTSGGSWLSVTQFGGSVSVNPSGLGLGTYQGSILISQNGLSSTTLPVTLTVTDIAVPVISANSAAISFSVPSLSAAPYSQTVAVTSDSAPTAFTVATSQFNGTWLTVSPMSGVTPATLTVSETISQYALIQQPLTASIMISGLTNTVTIPATLTVTGLQISQTALVFSQTGSGSQMQEIALWPEETISATVNQPWMSVTTPASYVGQAFVTVNSAGLAPGVYTGAVTITGAGLGPITVPVTFNVAAAVTSAPTPTISPSNFRFAEIVGEPMPGFQYGEVDTGGVSVPLTFSGGASWLYIGTGNGALTPASIRVEPLGRPPLPMGEYDSSFTIQSLGGSINVPVTLLVEPGPVSQPVVSQVVNAASGIAGGVSPGEILTIRGYGVGASLVGGLKLDASGTVVSNLNGLQVTFDGKAAPLIYTAAYQTNLIVPYEVAGKTSTVMQVTYAAAAGTMQTAPWVLPVVPAAPGIFTTDATGTGQGAIVNQDGTVNSAANPAARGSVISIYATGEGQTSPAGVTGNVTQSNLKKPVLSVAATIGGADAVVQYAGSAPDSVAGLMQVNVVVPQGISANTAAPVYITVGGTQSQAGVTLVVK